MDLCSTKQSQYKAEYGKKCVEKMVIMEQEGTEQFQSPGARLEHLLAQIGFEEDRGKITDLHNYLIDASPDVFGDLSYGAVRGWFSENAPPMRKIDFVVEALKKKYPFNFDETHIKTWWKVGGFYPFHSSLTEAEVEQLDADAKSKREKIRYVVMSLIHEESGDSFNDLSADSLREIDEVANAFVRDFTDPYQTTCPNHYLRAIIRDQLGKRPR